MLARPHLAAMGLSQRRSMETTTAQVPMEDLLQATEVIKVYVCMGEWCFVDVI